MSDLISRSALLKNKVFLCGGFIGDEYAKGYMEALDNVEEVINNAPTVEAKPVVHGKWNIGSKPRCSVCGKSALREYDRDDWLSYVPSDFCPHCGADMRGGKNE
jgi:hypothetical protein